MPKAKKGAKSAAKKPAAAKAAKRPAHWPEEIGGREVIGETGDGAAWVTRDENGGSQHVLK